LRVLIGIPQQQGDIDVSLDLAGSEEILQGWFLTLLNLPVELAQKQDVDPEALSQLFRCLCDLPDGLGLGVAATAVLGIRFTQDLHSAHRPANIS
jgi:hypothetical protein